MESSQQGKTKERKTKTKEIKISSVFAFIYVKDIPLRKLESLATADMMEEVEQPTPEQPTPTLSSEGELTLELKVLEAIDGVVSAKAYPVSRTDSIINKNTVAVKIDGILKPLIIAAGRAASRGARRHRSRSVTIIAVDGDAVLDGQDARRVMRTDSGSVELIGLHVTKGRYTVRLPCRRLIPISAAWNFLPSPQWETFPGSVPL